MSALSSLSAGDKNRLTVITTDLAEPEAFLLRMAEKSREKYPHRFMGRIPCVFYRLRYVPPCENFRELKNLILRIENAKGLRAHFHGIVALEVSEWMGHEREEYFSVILKYMYDHRKYLHCAMVLRECPEQRLQKFLDAVDIYIDSQVKDGTVFTNLPRLTEFVEDTFRSMGSPIRPPAAEMLAEYLLHSSEGRAKSLTIIDRAAEEILNLSGCAREIKEKDIQRYLGIHAVTPGKTGVSRPQNERSNAYEQFLL